MERNVLITGASTGIGAACALHMDRLGWRVFAGVRREADGDALRQQASERLTPVRIDVTDEASIREAAATIAAATGDAGLHGLVNNAGVSIAGPLEFLPIEELRRQLEVNVIGQMAVTQAFLPQIRKARGRIVNMGSIGGRLSTAYLGPYDASKFAIEALTDALRAELRPWGIEVSVVEPGSIATPIWEKSQTQARQTMERLPAEAHALYGPAIDAMFAAAEDAEKRGIPPERVAKAVAHALTSKRPRTRYPVGTDARIQMIVAHAPDRLRDRLINWQLKLPGKAPQQR